MFRKAVCFAAAFTIALAFVAGGAVAGGGCHVPAGSSDATGAQVSIKNCSFGPTILRAPVGGAITWVNDDFLPHAVNGPGWDGTAPFVPMVPGAKVTHTFATAGIYPYMCYVHPGMAGVVVVGDAAYPGPAPAPAAPIASPVRPDAPSVPLAVAGALAAIASFAGYGLAVLPRRWPALRAFAPYH